MNFIRVIFILVYCILVLISSSIASDELSATAAVKPVSLDVEKNESQIELPPLSNDNDKIASSQTDVVTDTYKEINVEAIGTINSATEQANIALDAKIEDKENIQRQEKENGNLREVNDNKGDGEKEASEKIDVDSEEGSAEDSLSKMHESMQENLTIPVFSEWTQQQQEAEKKLVELSSNSTESNKDTKNDTLVKHQIVKMRQKNYALPDCGAKILASNPEAQSTSSVLSDKDEYMLSPCTDRIWFVVELCDSIQAQRVELANFELFSSPLKAVSISLSNRFPTRDWTIAGHFEAKSDTRGVQSFDLKDVTLFGKFVRVDLEYTNTEHYCPLSFFRIFGTSEIEAFEVENEPEDRVNHLDDDDEFIHGHSQNKVENNKDNILNRAGQAVLSIVQKAAEVLVKSNGGGAKQNTTSSKNFDESCMSLSHTIVCETCSSDERLNLQNLISCKTLVLSNLLENSVKNHLINSIACDNVLGFNLHSDSIETNRNFIASILPEKYIAAMCNIVAGDQSKLPMHVEDLSDISVNLISKKDEVSLKNVSKKNIDTECKHNNPETVQTVVKKENERDITNAVVADNGTKENIEERTNKSLSNEENIFNRIEREPFLEVKNVEPPSVNRENTKKTESPPIELEQATVTKPFETNEEVKQEIPKIDSQQKITSNNDKVVSNSDVRSQQQSSNKVNEQDIKVASSSSSSSSHSGNESKNNQSNEIKTNGDQRTSTPSTSNAPESVFLRLSNRIKILEKNMTLSTQYLEELSRRYKKQIEDLQQSYGKLQMLYDSLNLITKENEKKDSEEKRNIKESIKELDTKSHYTEIILLTLTAFLVLQSVLIVVLFKRMSILKDAFIINEERTLIQKGVNNESAQHSAEEKASSNRTTSRKRSKQRVRKISAPNILSRQNGQQHHINTNNHCNGKQSQKNCMEVISSTPVLSRTFSAPHKFNEFELEMKENLTTIEQSTMLEENDEILIPNFQDLKIKDDDNDVGDTDDGDTKHKSKSKSDEDTASTASVKTTEDQNSSSSLSLARRLSTPTQFLKIKKTAPGNVKNGRVNNNNNQHHHKKAKSESPPKINSSSSCNNFIHKSNSFHAENMEDECSHKSNDESFKFRKNNSFKKLFKKLF